MRILLGLFLLSPLFSPSAVSGQGLRSFSFTADNDGFVFWKPPHDRTDWYYTNGFLVEAVLGRAPSIARVLGQDDPVVCPREPHPEPCVLTRLGLGQAIYTPQALFSNSPPVMDRPYAGWLFLRAGVARVTTDQARTVGLELGVTGDPSLASPLHRWFHRALGKYEPQGWDYQIPFEIAFALRYEERRALPIVPEGPGPTLHLEPRGSLVLGTLRTGAVAGLSLRAGWNSPSSLEWLGAGPRPFHTLVEVGVEGEVVLRDLFLDGSTWGQSVRAAREALVGRLDVRIQAGWKGLALEFGATRSTPQFVQQVGAHTVGTIRVIVHP